MATYDIIRSAIREIDGIGRDVSDDVIGIFARYGDDRISLTDVRKIMRDVDRVIDRAYGSTPTRARKSAVFMSIVRHTDLATETSFRAVYRSVRRKAAWRNPRRWINIERAMRTSSDPFAETYMSLFGPDARRRAIARTGFLDPNRRWVNPNGYRLSDRVWKAGRKNRRRINNALRKGVREGRGPITIGKELERYLNPRYAPVEYRGNGQIIRTNKYKRNPSGVSYARQLARTEVQHMAHASTREAVQSIEWLGAGIEWALSNAHPRVDICDTLAARGSNGYPRGVYTPGDFPAVPHPGCLCSARAWLPDRETVLNALERRYLRGGI